MLVCVSTTNTKRTCGRELWCVAFPCLAFFSRVLLSSVCAAPRAAAWPVDTCIAAFVCCVVLSLLVLCIHATKRQESTACRRRLSLSLSLSIRRSVSLVQKGFYAPLRRPFAIECFHRAAHGSTVLLLLLLLLLLQPPPARRGLSAGFRGDGAQINCGCDHRDKER